MDDQQLLRYSRQIMLPQIDVEGQQKLLDSTVLLVGLGGLGSPVATYLATAGIGTLVISDDDEVDLSNLQRQFLHTAEDIERPKTESAKQTLAALNPDINITTINSRLKGEALDDQIRQADVVIDACDNFESRVEINRSCLANNTPLVSGAVIRMEGQVTVFDPRQPNSPCYRCLYRDENEPVERCSETGVLAPVAGIIGSIQATEAIKLLLELGQPLTGRLLIVDATSMEIRTVNLKKDQKCPSCSHLYR